MIRELLYTTALDRQGNLVHIDNAEKGNTYYCPACKKEFILRKSGKTGKGSKRAHFAHNELTPNCSPESALHYAFKKLTTAVLERCLEENKALDIQWHCPVCSQNNRGNLLAKVTSIREEHHLIVCQPDIALLDVNDQVVAVIEIVVTHAPEENTLRYYKEKGIILVQIHLATDEDLKVVEKKLMIPDKVDFCLTPKCIGRDGHDIRRSIRIQPVQCDTCFHRLEKYFIEMESTLGLQRSDHFTAEEITIVRSKRQHIVERTHPTTKERYPVQHCMNCELLRRRYRTNRRW